MCIRTSLPALAALLLLLTACRGGGGDLPSPDVLRRWELRDAEGIGLISSVVQCGSVAYLADFQSKIRRFDFGQQRALQTLVLEGPPFALAADCASQRLFVVFPPRRGGTGRMEVQEVNAESGVVSRRYSLPSTLVRSAHFIPPASLVVGGLVKPDPGTATRQTTPETYFIGTHMAVRLALNTGASEPFLPAYEDSCTGAGACPSVAITPEGQGWIAAQPTSVAIARYNDQGRLAHRLDVASPGLLRSGRSISLDTSAEERVRWNAENSTLEGVFRTAEHVVVVHARPRLLPGWQFGQQLSFVALMNVFTPEGQLVKADVELPDLPVGHDGDGLWVIDYGPGGRTNGAPMVALLKIPVR